MAFAPLVLALVGGGCAPRTDSPSPVPAAANVDEPARATNVWVTSEDGLLALRFSVLTPRVKGKESIHVAAEIRNVSQQKLTVLRPFGDWFTAKAISLRIWDDTRQLPYTGPYVTYVIGPHGFAVVGPGEVVEDKMEFSIGDFTGIAPAGRYTLRYDYSYAGHWDTHAAALNSGISNAWRGAISSREVEVFRK
jgi:hypothetical protein